QAEMEQAEKAEAAKCAALAERQQAHEDERQALKELLVEMRSKLEDAQAQAEQQRRELVDRERAHAQRLDELRDVWRQAEMEQAEKAEAAKCAALEERQQAHEDERQALKESLVKMRVKLEDAQAQAEKQQRKIIQQKGALKSFSAEIVKLQSSRWWNWSRRFGLLPHFIQPAHAFKNDAEAHSAVISVQSSTWQFEQQARDHKNPVLDADMSNLDRPTSTTFLFDEMTTQIMNEIEMLEELLCASEAEFLRKAYHLILGRQPDPQGFVHYRRRMAYGASRLEVLADLLASHEVKSANRQGLGEIKSLVSFTGAGQKGWRKWLAIPRLFFYQLRATERRLGIISISLSTKLQLIEKELANINDNIIRIREVANRFHWPDSWPTQVPLPIQQTQSGRLVEKIGSVDLVNTDIAFHTGEKKHVAVEVENCSSEIWETSSLTQPFFLSYHWYFNNEKICLFDGIRTPLTKPLNPGERCRLALDVIAPEVSGNYLLEMTMVKEGECWLEERGLHTVRNMVKVSSIPFPPFWPLASHGINDVQRTPLEKYFHTHGDGE
ncbi:MAG TPA: DUF4214 domain-containing protein, partial [Accumulibacter sp.]|nr:DUF4214 domain-containing protein [Accumulibacter sp.]HNL76378.1 DUF4214 domain-containing protein [Accumulibacter sp.]